VLQLRPGPQSQRLLLQRSHHLSRCLSRSKQIPMILLSSSLRTIQINLHHSRTAALHLSQLILDLDIDVVLIQEPYAVNSTEGTILKYVPSGYSQFHSLDHDHAYGAAILVKNSLNCSICPQGAGNAFAGVKILLKNKPTYFFSVYCRPSLHSSASFLQQFLNLIPTGVLRSSVFAIDGNGKNKIWNSKTTDKKGTDLEALLLSHSLSIANVDAQTLDHRPLNTSFVDITANGDLISPQYWHSPNILSLSDHPYIMFNAVRSNSFSNPLSQQPNLLPSPERCDQEAFKIHLAKEIGPLSSLSSNLKTTEDIDCFIKSLLD